MYNSGLAVIFTVKLDSAGISKNEDSSKATDKRHSHQCNDTEFPVEVLLSHDFSEGKVATFVRTPWE